MLTISLTVSSSDGRPVQKRSDVLPVVKSKPKSLEFLDTEKTDFGFITRMRNTSRKSITAYTVSLCDTPLFAEDYSIGNRSIEPGRALEIKTPIESVSHQCGGATEPTLTILAVVFDDRSTEGEFRWAKGILDDRRGQKIQLKRINRLLAKAAAAPDADDPIVIEKLKADIAGLPIDEAAAPAVRGGLATAKQTTLQMIAELEQWQSRREGIQSGSSSQISLRSELAGATTLKEGFVNLISFNEKCISKY
jgi:hypothetical protein